MYEKQTLLHKKDGCEVWLVKREEDGSQAVLRLFLQKGHLIKVYRTLLHIRQINLPAVFDVSETESGFSVLEEYIQGVPVSDLLMGGKIFSERECKNVTLQLCAALGALHENHIVHRDVKPGNLLITAENTLKLIDFDAARFFDVYREKDTRLLGTQGYAAPEQYGFSQTDFRTDIYALGVTIKEMLGPHSSLGFRKILTKCTRLDPAQRYQSIPELERACKYCSVLKVSAYVSVLALCFGAAAFLRLSLLTAPQDMPAGDPSQAQMEHKMGRDPSAGLAPIAGLKEPPEEYSFERAQYALSLPSSGQGAGMEWETPMPDRGNTPGNIANGNYVREYGGWTYIFYDSTLWRIKNDDSLLEKLYYGTYAIGENTLQVYQDQIYLKSRSSTSNVSTYWRFPAEGGQPEDLGLEAVNRFQIADGWIYYKWYANRQSCFVRAKTDGSSAEVVSSIADSNVLIGNVFIDGGWIYFDNLDEKRICRMRLEDGSDLQAYEAYSNLWGVHGGFLYYRSETNSERLCRTPVEGGEAEQLTGAAEKGFHIQALHVQEDWVYFSTSFYGNNSEKAYAVYRMKHDGSQMEKLFDTEEAVEEISLAAGWVYFKTDSGFGANPRDIYYRGNIDKGYIEELSSIMPPA